MSSLANHCAYGAIDVHTHVVPEDFPPYLGHQLGVRWPSMAPAQACHRHVMLDGAVYRTVSHQCWDTTVRVADMETQGLQRQVLSPMPELLSYGLEGDDAALLCRFLNEQIAGMVQRAPQRFIGLGAVPLQDVDRAVAELQIALRRFGLAGVEIGSNINGVPIGDPRFLPFFKAAESLGAAVFVHALRPAGMDRLVGPPILEQTLAFPGEVGLAAASMLTGGTLAACPQLRIAFSHGGGTLALLLPRLQHAWQIFPALQAIMPNSPSEAVQKMYYDNLVYDGATIQHLLRVFGPTQLLLGSDYPFVIMDREPLARVAGLALDSSTLDLLRGENALRWLGEVPSPPTPA